MKISDYQSQIIKTLPTWFYDIKSQQGCFDYDLPSSCQFRSQCVHFLSQNLSVEEAVSELISMDSRNQSFGDYIEISEGQYTEQLIQSFRELFFKTFENESWFDTTEFESMVSHCQETLRLSPQEAAKFIEQVKEDEYEIY